MTAMWRSLRAQLFIPTVGNRWRIQPVESALRSCLLHLDNGFRLVSDLVAKGGKGGVRPVLQWTKAL